MSSALVKMAIPLTNTEVEPAKHCGNHDVGAFGGAGSIGVRGEETVADRVDDCHDKPQNGEEYWIASSTTSPRAEM